MDIYAFWNNKGGTGKTSLAFQVICAFAQKHKNKRVLVIDICPQANLSELFLGGLMNNGSQKLLERQGLIPRCTIGGYFQQRLPSPYAPPPINGSDFVTRPNDYNSAIPQNIELICGDPVLELQSNAMNTLANNLIPGTNTWVAVIDWVRDLIASIADDYDVVFLDTNPSFSIYTQTALSVADKLILPVMADDSSKRAIQNAFSLVYGLKLPSEIYSQHAFATRLREAKRQLPKVHLVAKNRITQYMGPASGYAAVLKTIEQDVSKLLTSSPDMFTFGTIQDGVVEIRDFQTTGVVAFARGAPFFAMQAGKLDVGGRRVAVDGQQLTACKTAIGHLVSRLN